MLSDVSNLESVKLPTKNAKRDVNVVWGKIYILSCFTRHFLFLAWQKGGEGTETTMS